MKPSLLLFLTTVSLCSFNSFSQSEKSTTVKYAYIDVIKTYERVAEKGYKSAEMFQKIGDSYYSNSQLEKAANWYCELFAMNTDLEPECYYRYAKCLISIDQNDMAADILEKCNKKTKNINKD